MGLFIIITPPFVKMLGQFPTTNNDKISIYSSTSPRQIKWGF